MVDSEVEGEAFSGGGGEGCEEVELDVVMVKSRGFVMVAGRKGVRLANWRRKGRI